MAESRDTTVHPMTFRLPEHVYESLRTIAFNQRRTMNELVIEAIEQTYGAPPVPDLVQKQRDRLAPVPQGDTGTTAPTSQPDVQAVCTHKPPVVVRRPSGLFYCERCKRVVEPGW